MSMLSAFVTGVAGEQLTPDEWCFLQDARPCGLILFARNCRTPQQVRALIDSFKDAIGRDDLFIMVDQEGGRVQRMKPPTWRQIPSAVKFGALYRQDPENGLRAARAAAQLVATELSALGFNVNCVPVLDMPVEGAHGVIGDRAYASDPDAVVALGKAVAEGTFAGGVLPCMKHMPGHGRSTADTHHNLPVVDTQLAELEKTDFEPFRRLNFLPLAMSAHVLFNAIDPEDPATTSETVIEQVIRDRIGFDGLLFSDDASMNALAGGIGDRVRRMLAAGCDVALHCNGELPDMLEVAANSVLLEGDSERRFHAAFEARKPAVTFDASDALAAIEEAMAVSG